MPITQDIVNKLITFITAQGFTINDATGVENNHQWSLTCPCHHHVSIRIDSLKQSRIKNKEIVCPECKEIRKKNRFANISDVTFIGDRLVQCNKCELTYHYHGDYYAQFNCYCKLTQRTQEHALYKALHEFFPKQMGKEIAYIGNHKCDTTIFTDDGTFYIELDELGHFYEPKSSQDEVQMKAFLKNRGCDQYVIRIQECAFKADPEAASDKIAEITLSPSRPIYLSWFNGEFPYKHLNLPRKDYGTFMF